uniref:Putative mid1-interacting protein 1-b n=1 Tax=Triatoma infestans TaxID=30076 RepID=A0A161MPR0_TRIIF
MKNEKCNRVIFLLIL